MKSTLDFSRYFRLVDSIDPCVSVGTVTEMVGLLIESSGAATALGDFCEIHTTQSRTVRVQVIGLIRSIRRIWILPIIVPSVPPNAGALGNDAIGFLHPRPFDAAQHQ